MARGKRNRKTSNNKRRRVRPRVRAGRSTTSSSLGSIVYKGVRSILAMIPGGNFLTAAADIVFSPIGITSSFRKTAVPNSSQYLVTAEDAKTIGLGVNFYLTTAMLLGSCPQVVASYGSATNMEVCNCATNFRDSRLSGFKVTAKNRGPNTVCGNWIMAFWPFYTAEDSKILNPASAGETAIALRQAPFYVEGPSRLPLQIAHTFPSTNIYARTAGEHDRTVGLVAIGYFDQIRSAYTDFSPSDFNPEVEVSGTVVLSNRTPFVKDTFSNKVSTPGNPSGYRLISPKGTVTLMDDDTFTCVHNSTGGCKVTGTTSHVTEVSDFVLF